MDRPTILLAVNGSTDAYAEALARAGFEPTVLDPNRPILAAHVDMAVLDCDLPAEVVATLAQALQSGRRTPALLLVGEGSDVPDIAGASGDDIALALKPMPPEALVYRLQALLIRTGRELPDDSAAWAADAATHTAQIVGEGHVVSVFAPKGGVGKTTIAVNMAVALRQQTRAEVLLLDADVGVGNVTSVLEVPYKMGLVDLADSPPEEWSDAAFEHVATTHADSGLRVMTWGSDPADSERVNVDLLLAALRWGRNHHSYVIVDNHPGYDDRTMAMLAVANEIFLVVTPEVGAIRNSSQFLELARDLGLASNVRVIVNRANHGIRIADMSSALGLPIAATVVSNGPKAVVASNEGKPVVLKYPREEIATDLHGVARLISQPEATTTVTAQPTARRWWTRFGTRTSQA